MVLDYPIVLILYMCFRLGFFLSGFMKNSQVQSVTTRPPPNGRALAQHRFPQRRVTDWTSLFFGNPDRKNELMVDA